MKIKRFFKKHYKKVLVSLICILLSCFMILSAAAQTILYNLWKYYDNSRYDAYFVVGSTRIPTRISNHNSNVPDAILGYNVPDIEAENGLKRFHLYVRFDTSLTPKIFDGDTFELSGEFISNFSMVGEDGRPCYINLVGVSLVYSTSNYIYKSTSFSLSSPIDGTTVSKYTWSANFDTFNHSGSFPVSAVHFYFELDRPAVSSAWGTHELQYSLSFNNNISLKIYRVKSEQPIYTAPDDSTLNSSLGLEDSLLNEVGGNLDALDGLLNSSNIDDDTIYKPISAFTSIFQDLFEQDNAVGFWLDRLLNFSVAVGLSGFVLNIVVGIVSHFSAHSRDGSNNPKGGGS